MANPTDEQYALAQEMWRRIKDADDPVLKLHEFLELTRSVAREHWMAELESALA